MRKVKGFTLIELLVAIGILGIVGGITTIIFFTTLQSSSKSEVLREVKQNGDFAISVMERMIRNANSVNSCSGSSTSLTITNPDGRTTQFSLSGTQIASNGAMLTSTKVSASNLSFTCTRTSGKPDVVGISFTLSQAGSPTRPEERASMTFQTSFTLSQAGSPTRPEERASINFQTTVSLRTY